MKKKLISIILTLVMVLAMIPMTSGVAFGEDVVDAIFIEYYTTDANTGALDIASVASKYTIDGNQGTSYSYMENKYIGGDHTKPNLEYEGLTTFDIYKDASKNIRYYIEYVEANHSIEILLKDFKTNENSKPGVGISIEAFNGKNATITLRGKNIIYADAAGIFCEGNLTIKGEEGATLEIYANNSIPEEEFNGKGICVQGDITFEDIDVTVCSKNACVYSTGNIYVKGTSIVRAKVTDDKVDISAFDITQQVGLENTVLELEKHGEIVSHAFGGNCIQAASVEGTNLLFKKYTFDQWDEFSGLLSQDDFISFDGDNGDTATDIIYAKNKNTVVTLYGESASKGATYPETWEPYYETLALKIAACAEIEAKKMLEAINVKEEEPVVEEPIELVASAECKVAPDGKDSVNVTWTDKNGKELNFEGYEIFRSTTLDGEYVCMFDTNNEWYFNTLIKKGEKYYYKVRGYNIVSGEKVYTEFSNIVEKEAK